MKTTSPLSVLLCCVFLGSCYSINAQSEKSSENKESVESKAAAERAFDAVVQEDRKSNLALTYRPRGTGQTTGHIATITVENVGSNPVQLVATGQSGLDALAFVDEDINEAANVYGIQGKYENGKIDLSSKMVFIPTSGKYQSYVATESKWPPGISQTSGTPDDNGQTPITTIGPGESVVIPVHGYCADIRTPPVPAGEGMNPASNWVSPGEAIFPAPNEFDSYGVQTVDAPSDGGPYLANIPPDIDPGPGQTIALGNKTDPKVTAAFLFDAISRITITTDILQDADLISTPFSGVSDKEREAVIQQTLWLYSSVLTDNVYTKDDFSDRMTTQYEDNTGTKIKNAAPGTQESLDKGVNDFWNSFNLVGTEAKVIKDSGANQVTIPPDVKDKLENALGKHDTSGVKPHTGGATSDANDGMGANAYETGNKVHTDGKPDMHTAASEVAHVLQSTTESGSETEDKPRCKCQEIDVEVVTVKGDLDELNPDRMNITMETVSAAAEAKESGDFKHSNEFEISREYNIDKGDAFSVSVKSVDLSCACEEGDCPTIHGRLADKGKLSASTEGKYVIKNTNNQAKILAVAEGTETDQTTDGAAQYEYKAEHGKKTTETLHFQISAYCSSDDCLRNLCVYDFKIKIKFNQ